MFFNNYLIFIFDLVRKIVQNKPGIIYATERSENTPGQVHSGADLTSGRVDQLPLLGTSPWFYQKTSY